MSGRRLAALPLLALVGLLGQAAGCAPLISEDLEDGLCETTAESGAVAARGASAAPPLLIYLDRDGATLAGGTDDAALGVSSVVASHGRSAVTIPASTLSDGEWAEVVSCVS